MSHTMPSGITSNEMPNAVALRWMRMLVAVIWFIPRLIQVAAP
jgi:hypothetical protein